ncbi:MAG: DUF3343 domain-containing protein [Syntrophobacteraceae bacterium]
MNSALYTVILVYSTSYALRAEKVLGEQGIPCKLIPVPRHISSDCGSCIRILQADKDRVLPVLTAAKVETAGIHDL